MPKPRIKFVCQQCGASFLKWTGKCENCGAWNSLLESAPEVEGRSVVARSTGREIRAERLHDVKVDAVSDRISTGISDLDLVLGGGLMPGAVILVAGQPGIGKSTLLMQIAANVSKSVTTNVTTLPQLKGQSNVTTNVTSDVTLNEVLYVSGEESASQVKLRAERLCQKNNPAENLHLASTTNADDVAATIATGKYKLAIVDSMQTMAMAEIASAPGTVSQITNSANIIIRAAKAANVAVLLVGHVTKEGSIAGPKVLEHIVDVVLQFEGDRYGGFKIVRAIKNRYGSTAEAAIFDMTEKGLEIVANPSAALLAERREEDGSVVLATTEGNRPLLVEIQALVNPTNFGYPKRAASGFDLNRLTLLIAVLERRTKLKLSESDIYLNVVGGIRISDPAADLAVCMAIASAAAQRKLPTGAVCFGEVGLGGEIRSATMVDKRIAEAKKLGFKYAIAPISAARHKFVIGAADLRDALNQHLK
ncbi:DNA repair protein RadA [Candidatus Saccharibacteria bacterium]|nr:DNA repair protein RadA [Candidatus Saccharibacteria bacterium]MCL1963228.1 DNA repair protein RadA [Candidatus Saccharibacteria bacterium]